MQDEESRNQMLGLLSTIHENRYGDFYREIDKKNLKYVIYLRKSSDESSEKQDKSIGDQLQDIKERLLDPHGITNYHIVKEEHSAKEADTRLGFSKMLIDLRTGKYEGLIAWHPDRLARNMREAGELIDMLDKYVIKDLLFATATYDSTAMGKMMLGISFVLSKQYSEHLSESVLRGYGRRIQEGKYLGKLVHGYRILDEGFLEPDGNNFLIIKQAFQKRMKADPENLVDIAKWLNTQNYEQAYGREQTRSRTKFSDNKLSDMFRETIYAGFLQYGKAKPVDLTKLYGFEPMITADEFLKLNRIDNMERIVAKGNVLTKTAALNLLRKRVYCGHCDHHMIATTGTGKTKTKTYVYFRCDYAKCPYRIGNPDNPKKSKHSIRAHVVTNAAISTLSEAEFDLKKAYKNYVIDAEEAVEAEKIELLSEERRVRANWQQTKRELERAKGVVSDPTKADVAKYYEDDIKKYVEVDIPSYQPQIDDIIRRRNNLKASVVSEAKFLELIKNLVIYIGQLQDLEQINEILVRFYSNFTVLNKSVSVITFNPEWYNVLNPAWLGLLDSNQT
ncbi:MAG TPA: recombinase family protein [Candidatus Saccharimonadales bacterium]|nr:recombinase family protein [Candidatus Saccharimonadales bacterium]